MMILLRTPRKPISRYQVARFLLLLPLLFFAACGGGETQTAANPVTPNPSRPNTPSAPAPTVNQLLKNPNFEAGFTHIAPNWEDNSWESNCRGSNEVNYARASHRAKQGQASQKITVSSICAGDSGAVQFRQNFSLTADTAYQASVWLRSDAAMPVKVQLRYRDAPYKILAEKVMSLNGQWQSVTLRGGSTEAVAGSLMIVPLQTGTFYIDKASIADRHVPIGLSQATPVPDTLFGITINKPLPSLDYPRDIGVNVQMVRLHDTGLRWNELETEQDKFQWRGFDEQVNRAHDHGVKVMYTLGQTPQWASARPNERSIYSIGFNGGAAEPAQIRDWIDYVDKVSKRYRGKIQAYEIWNEVDLHAGVDGTTGLTHHGFYSGSSQKLVGLAKHAYQTIKRNDPNALVIAPNVTDIGVSELDDFIRHGGDQYVDAYAIHLYSSANLATASALSLATPEGHRITADIFKQLLLSHGISKPIWTTEGAVIASQPLTAAERDGSMARAFLIPLLTGSKNFSWYTWEGIVPNSVKMFDSNQNQLQPSGVALGHLTNWLQGATLQSWQVDANQVYKVVMSNAEGVSHLYWKPDISQNNYHYNLSGSPRVLHQLDGSQHSITGVSISIGPRPVRVQF